jgi:hypothetical protein
VKTDVSPAARRRTVTYRLLSNRKLLLLVVILYGLAAWLRVRLYAGEPTALIGFGCHDAAGCLAQANRSSLPRPAVVFTTGGYDGQFFYYLARELYGGPPAVLDSEPFRRARIGLPVIAGPLLATSETGRQVGLGLTLLVLHLGSVWLLLRAKTPRFAAVTFALNPFSLVSFMLSVADGAALSLAVAGVVAWHRTSRLSRGLGVVLMAAALLTKETLALVPIALGASVALDSGMRLGARARGVAWLGASFIPMLVWWHHVGFSFGLAAARGGRPFVGLFEHLRQTDLQRGLLAVIAVLCLVVGGLVVRRSESRAAGLLLIAVGLLVSAATAEEYWAAFANIARLFTPLLAAATLPLPGPNAPPAVRRLGLTLCAGAVLLSGVVLVREATRSALPFFILR